ncbi:LysM peptidoglycan-binding domain-containing protein [Bacillus sp. 1NLA3E]|uniref:LysM peptidoglycan-binding domain-containing protein n=1 Tax=Bacillus sp. 1NLA3E TaxID=666686 RepID=UPI000247E56F|nr:LysM peptidoglycan-binding domain-containing protein [Bacillus sp. 1NLA3E]AGK52566.1 cell wall hydrolase SleB [Bacillus sp. 1NLA3E]
MSNILKTRNQRIAEIRKKKVRLRNQKMATLTVVGAITALTLMGSKVNACSADYTVKKGDTLYGLAKKYQISINQLMDVNNLASEKLFINQQLLVPDEHLSTSHTEETSGLYTVKKGDTLYSLSKKYQVSTNLLMVANGLSSDKIKVSQKLLVPYNDQTPSSEEVTGNYFVKKGDTLFSLAKKYDTSVIELKKANNLRTDNLYIGQQISVPSESHSQEEEEIYTVVPGDSLSGIASRFGVTMAELKKANVLHQNMVLIGQKLHIPGTANYFEATVVGAADPFSVEFEENGEPLVLTVPYGTATDYQKKSGQKGTIIYKNGALISFL